MSLWKSALASFSFYLLVGIALGKISRSSSHTNPDSSSSSSGESIHTSDGTSVNPSNSSETHGVQSFNKSYPFFMPTQAQLGVNQTSPEAKLYAIAILTQSMKLPKSLSRLLFNGNDSMNLEELTAELVSKKPRMVGDDEYACINRCGSNMKNEIKPASTTSSINCSKFEDGSNCIDKCIQPTGHYARYVHNFVKALKEDLCSEHPDPKPLKEMEQELAQCLTKVLNDDIMLLKQFKHSLDCYLDFEDAVDNKDTCYVLKYCVLDLSFGELEKDCGKRSKKSIGYVKTALVLGLTVLSDGRLVDECPMVYSDH